MLDPKNLLVGDASLGWAFASSRQGSSHIRLNKLCQDASDISSGSVAGNPYLIAAVADGHGDDRHDQSHLGSTLAVQAAIEELLSMQTLFGNGTTSSRLANEFKNNFPRHLGKRWREAVFADARSRQFLDSEGTQDKSTILSRYGTTLLVSLVVGKILLVGQIGDGDAIIVRKDGGVYFPLFCESDDVGGETDSLCSVNAHMRWRTACLDCSEEMLILLCTDGLVNAFVNHNHLQNFAQSMLKRILDYGLVKVAGSVPSWLDDYSDRGSGDDITLAVILVNPENHLDHHTLGHNLNKNFSEKPREDEDVASDRPTGFCRDSQGRTFGEEEAR